MTKPPYRVPSMAELAAVEQNGYNLVSTFSGAGGSCLGFRWAGFRAVYASEFIKAARETYAANHGFAPDGRDVRQVTGESIREMAWARGLGEEQEVDVLEGSPPCASFSMSGSREDGWGEVRKYSDTKQRVDDLFGEYCRLVRELRPRVLVAENVTGLLVGAAKGWFLEIVRELEAAGYVVRAKVLDAQWLGVPQARQRVILIGAREDLGVQPIFPRPFAYRYTIRDALPHLGGVRRGSSAPHERKRESVDVDGPAPTILQRRGGSQFEVADGAQIVTRPRSRSPRMRLDLDRPMPTVLASAVDGAKATMTGKIAQRFAVLERDPENGHKLNFDDRALVTEWRKLQPGGSSDRYPNLARPSPDRPVPTVTATGGNSSGTASVTHPHEPRKFTIAELRQLCGFPADFVLTGTYPQQWERLGRAVPPPMMHQVALCVRELLDHAGGKR